MYLADPADVSQREKQCIDGHVAHVESLVFRVDVEDDGVRVGESEGPLRPADVADRDPMRRADGTFPGETSRGIKVAAKWTNGWDVAAEEEW